MIHASRMRILGVPVDPITMQVTLDRANVFIEKNVFAHLIGVNADKVLQTRGNPTMAKILERCEIVNADGASMLLAARWLSSPLPERVAGIDLMYRLCALASERGYSVFLLGATEAVVQKAKINLEAEFPGIDIHGYRDGYFNESDYGEVAEQLKNLGSSLVFVGITSPKKEHLIEFF